jgi:hypothetical protein
LAVSGLAAYFAVVPNYCSSADLCTHETILRLTISLIGALGVGTTVSVGYKLTQGKPAGAAGIALGMTVILILAWAAVTSAVSFGITS